MKLNLASLPAPIPAVVESESGLGILGPKRKCFALEGLRSLCSLGKLGACVPRCALEKGVSTPPQLYRNLLSEGLPLKPVVTVLHVYVLYTCGKISVLSACVYLSICEYMSNLQN